ncbi:MAG: STM3941 family protein [Hyphomonadaceae bacterium]
MAPILFRPSRWKAALLGLLAIAMTALSLWLAFFTAEALFYRLCGAAGVLLFGAAIPAALRRVFDRTPVIEVSEWGVRDRRQGVAAPWAQIRAARVWIQAIDAARVPWIVLEVEDADAVYERRDAATRALRALNRRLGYPEVVLKTQGLPRAHRGVMEAIAAFRPALVC